MKVQGKYMIKSNCEERVTQIKNGGSMVILSVCFTEHYGHNSFQMSPLSTIYRGSTCCLYNPLQQKLMRLKTCSMDCEQHVFARVSRRPHFLREFPVSVLLWSQTGELLEMLALIKE